MKKRGTPTIVAQFTHTKPAMFMFMVAHKNIIPNLLMQDKLSRKPGFLSPKLLPNLPMQDKLSRKPGVEQKARIPIAHASPKFTDAG